jgi:hypothetical protein
MGPYAIGSGTPIHLGGGIATAFGYIQKMDNVHDNCGLPRVRCAESVPSRRRFSQEEDEMLRSLIKRYGSGDWASICRHMPGRNARQCRHRWNNYLADNHQRIAWTDAEEQIILDHYREIGPKWVQISKYLIGRTGNDVKNRWHKHISKRLRRGELSGVWDVRLDIDTPYYNDDSLTSSPSQDCGLDLNALLLHESEIQNAPKFRASGFLDFVLN